MNITVTGSSGFVGTNLSSYLRKQNHVIQRLSMRRDSWKIELDQNANAIIHLAGKAHDTSNTSSTSEYFEINTELTKQLFDSFLASNIQNFIYFSSVKAVADTVENILDETAVADPKTPYGMSKQLAEQYIMCKEIPENKRVFIVRPCMIHGPGNKGNLNLLYKIVSKGIPWPLGAFDNKRSFLSIDNLNFMILKILENKTISSGIYNICDDQPLATNELIRIINQTTGKKSRILTISKSVITTISSLGDLLKLPLNSEKLKKLTENYVVSNDKIKIALNIKALPLSVFEGLEITLKSFR